MWIAALAIVLATALAFWQARRESNLAFRNGMAVAVVALCVLALGRPEWAVSTAFLLVATLRVDWRERTPAQVLAWSFFLLIFVGGLLLTLPIATTDGLGATPADAIFTMSSATSVTGLVVQDTGTYFTWFGLLVVFVVMQTGAIGIMVLAASFAALVGGRVPVQQQAELDEAGFGAVQSLHAVDDIKRLGVAVTLVTLLIEGAGAAIMYLLWLTGIMELRPEYDTPLQAAWWCIFHSVSAFCHAGFSLEPNSLITWHSNHVVTGLFIVLITLGAVGFPVLADMFVKDDDVTSAPWSLMRWWRRRHIQTKVVLVMTASMYVIGMFTMLFWEYNGLLKDLSAVDKISAALFQSVTLRSAGFNTVPIDQLAAPTLIICVLFMFVGSAPASTGGGVRVTTAAVVMLTVRAILRGDRDVEIFGRRIDRAVVYRSVAIVLISTALVITLFMAMLATQKFTFEELLFETMSAYGTVGLSLGITGDLDDTGKWIISAAMYVGRVGPLTMALAVAQRIVPRTFRYATADVEVA